jgi:RND family efflux transporter MFP subunit
MTEGNSRRSSVHFVVLPVVIAAIGLAAYGIWSRNTTLDRLKVVSEDASLPRVQLVTPQNGPAEQTLTLPGEVAAWNEAQIYGQVSGYVKHWFKDYGAKVETGELLADIDTPALDAEYKASESAFDVAQAKVNLAALTAKRFNQLSGGTAVAQQEIDNKNAALAEQLAELAQSRQRVDHYRAMLDFKRLRAPFAGVVTARRVNMGDFINADGGSSTSQNRQQAPFTVSDVHQLRIFVSIPQEFARVLKPGLSAILRPTGKPGEKIPAKFLTMAGAVDRASRTIVTEFVLDNPGNELMPGAYVSVDLKFPGDPSVLVIPSQALLFRANGSQVALVDAQGRVHLQDIVVGLNFGLNIQVLSGLKADDKIVADPSLGLLDGQLVKIVQPVPGYRPGKGDRS